MTLKLPLKSVSTDGPPGLTETVAATMARRVWLSVTWPAIVAVPGVAVGVGLGNGLLGLGNGRGTGRAVGIGVGDAPGFGVTELRPGAGLGTEAFVAS